MHDKVFQQLSGGVDIPKFSGCYLLQQRQSDAFHDRGSFQKYNEKYHSYITNTQKIVKIGNCI